MQYVRWWWDLAARALRSPWAPLILFTYSFVETLITLIPIDPFAVGAMAADKSRTYSTALYIVLGSLLGALVGYWIGHTALDSFGAFLIDHESTRRTFEHIKTVYLQHEFLIAFTAAFVPIPKTPVILAAGFLSGNLLTYMVAWAIGRTLHFFAEAFIVQSALDHTISRGMRTLMIGSIIFAVVVVAYIALQVSRIG